MQIRSNNKFELSFLTEAVAGIKEHPDSAKFCFQLIYLGFMKPNWIFKIAAKCISWKHKQTINFGYYCLFAYEKKIRDDLIDDCCNHILNGKDKSSKHSVGGYNQEEINKLISLVRKYPLDPSSTPS